MDDCIVNDVKGYLRWIKRQEMVYVSESANSSLLDFCENSELRKMSTKEHISMVSAVSSCVKTADNERLNVVKNEGMDQMKNSVADSYSQLPPQIEDLRREIASCQKCSLSQTRTTSVFGNGNPEADLMFIGEAPGANEDRTGIPFCGAAGNLLNRELAKNGVSREEVFVANCLKCRPPENRDPSSEELALCEEYLHRQIDLIAPKMLCVLGRYAAGILLKHPIAIMRERGCWSQYHNLPLFICLHPAAILHQPNNRQYFEADIKTLCEAYEKVKREKR